MAGKGGNNPNGRKVGSSTQLTRAKANEICSTGKSPLDVMMRNMWFWDEHAQTLEQRIRVAMDDLAKPEDNAEESAAKLAAAKDLLKNFLSARQNAQSCAVDAAPYVHPRLQAITLKKKTEKTIIVEATLAPPTPGITEDRSYRDGYQNVMPIRRAG